MFYARDIYHVEAFSYVYLYLYFQQKLRRDVLLPGDSDEMDTSEKSSNATPRSRLSEDEFLDTYRSTSPLMLER